MVSAKAKTLVNKMRRVVKEGWRLNKRTLLIIHKGSVRGMGREHKYA